MSTYMYVKCLDCKATCDTNMNHHEVLIRSFWKMREALYQVRDLDTEGYLEVSIMGYGQELPNFLMDHHNHTLELWDEYDYQYDWETLNRLEKPEEPPSLQERVNRLFE